MDTKLRFRQALPLVDGWINYQTYVKEIPGAAIGVFVEDEVILDKAYGYANLEKQVRLTGEHLFRIASHSKLFTATAVMRLYNEGRISLDDGVSKHLPWFKSEFNSLQEICIHHLLTHTSGIISDGDCHFTKRHSPNREDIKTRVKNGISVFKTSETVKYSNFGYAVLGQLIEAVTGRSYGEYIQETILDPLGMRNTFTDFNDENLHGHATGYTMKFPGQERKPVDHFPARAMDAAAGFSSTVGDLIKFYRAHMYGDASLLPDHVKREMQRVQVSFSTGTRGLGFEIANYPGGEVVYYHSGGYPGFKSLSGLNQKDKVILVVLINAADGPNYSWFNAITTLFSSLVNRWEALKTPDGEEAPDFGGLTGYYVNEIGVAMICQVGSKLVLVSPDADDPASTLQILRHVEGNRFLTPSGHPFTASGETIEFVDGSDGEKVLIDHHGCEAKRLHVNLN